MYMALYRPKMKAHIGYDIAINHHISPLIVIPTTIGIMGSIHLKLYHLIPPRQVSVGPRHRRSAGSLGPRGAGVSGDGGSGVAGR